jgi:cell wall-associated NlpC family hydrolase
MTRPRFWTRFRSALAALGVLSAAVGVIALAVPANASAAPQAAPAASAMTKVVQYATAIRNGHSEHGWRGGKVPYSWDGGHGAKPGPTLGSCVGYTGSIHPCPADKTVGTDCSGFVRWVYDLAIGHDVLGPGSTNDELATGHLHKTAKPQPGDLVYYGSSTTNTHHVGIYVGGGKMIDALETGTNVETDSVQAASDLLGYFHYTA